MHTTSSLATSTDTVTHIQLDGYFTAATTTGLVKSVNEDRFGYTITNGVVRICIADGHWGSDAAERAVTFWLDTTTTFPHERAAAHSATRTLQSALYDAYGTDHMDEAQDFTPETSFIAIEIDGSTVHMVGYGDCRLFIARQGAVRFQLDIHDTWLGAFSHLGLRQRMPVDQATVFAEQQLGDGDRLCLFTDGIDECVYDTPTLSTDALARLSTATDPENALEAILSQVFSYGAEDNATLAIISR